MKIQNKHADEQKFLCNRNSTRLVRDKVDRKIIFNYHVSKVMQAGKKLFKDAYDEISEESL